MKWVKLFACLSAVTLIFISGTPSQAQNIVFNGDFETESITPKWTLTGGNANTTVAKFQTVSGVYSWCMKRRPGSPNDNGGIEQDIHLIENVNYLVEVNVAVVESG